MTNRLDRTLYRRALRLIGTCAALTFLTAAAHAVQGQYCRVEAPGWAITSEMPTRNSFGADLQRVDAAAVASYLLVGVPAELRNSPWSRRWYETPEQGVMAMLTKMGTEPVHCSAPSPVAGAASLRVMQCRTPKLTGEVAYQVQSLPGGGYLLAIRTAGAPHASWARYRAEASAVATALRCNVPFLPSPPDSSGAGAGRGGKGDDGSRYNPRTGTEEWCDEKTGTTHDVNPSRWWDPIGPEGPGPYVQYGNERRKLRPGRC